MVEARASYILAVGFVIRLGITFFSGLSWYMTDSFIYFKQADAILHHRPISGFPNGYPLLIAAVKLIGNEEVLLAFVHVILSTAVVLIVFLISRRLRLGILAGLLLAVYPNQLNLCRLFLSETPTTFLLAAAVALFITGKYFESALALSVACVFRTSLLPIIPGLMVTALYFKLPFRSIQYFLIGCVIIAGLYTTLVVLNIVAPSNNLGLNVLQSVTFYSSHMSYDPSAVLSARQQAYPMATYAWFLLDHPFAFLLQRLDSLWELWGPWPLDASRSIPAKVLIGIRFPVLVLACVGLFRNRKNAVAWVLFTPIFCVTMVHFLMYSQTRYTVPVEPFTALLASASFRTLQTAIIPGRRRFGLPSRRLKTGSEHTG